MLHHPKLTHHSLSFHKSSINVVEHESLGPDRGTLIFLHGRFSTSDIWNPLVRSFQKEFNCVFVEFPGFGRSFTLDDFFPTLLENAKFVSDFIKLRQGPVILVGQDSGAAIAQLVAVHEKLESEKTAGLVFINPLSLGEELPMRTWYFVNFGLRLLVNKAVREAMGISADDRENILKSWNTRASRKPLIHAIRALHESWPGYYERMFWKKAMTTIKVPVLLLAGMRDPFDPSEHAFDLVRRIPETYFFLSEECGHWPSVENPDWVISKMRDFVEKVAPRTLRKKA